MRARIFALVGAVGLIAEGSVSAQGNDNAAVILHEKLVVGDRVTLSLTSRVVTGELMALGQDALLVQTDAAHERVAFEAVNEVRRKRMGLRRGTIIGAGVGVVPAWIVVSWFNNEGGNATMPAAFLIGGGAAIGAGIDALLNLNRTVYRRATRPSVSVAPAIGMKATGVRAAIAW